MYALHISYTGEKEPWDDEDMLKVLRKTDEGIGFTAQIHHVVNCVAARCRILDLNATQIWLKHSGRGHSQEGMYHGMPRG